MARPAGRSGGRFRRGGSLSARARYPPRPPAAYATGPSLSPLKGGEGLFWRRASYSGAHLAVAADEVFVGGQFGGADRPTRRQPLGRDADLGAHAELAAIGELGRGVDQHDGAVDLAQKAFGGRLVLGHDRVGVVRAVA